MARKDTAEKTIYIRNFIFGVEDSLVSTVGLLSGVASAGVAKQTVFLTGMILIFVEALSMAVGSFLSEESVEEFEKKKGLSLQGIIGSTIMFFSYFLSGFVPLSPYILFEKETAFAVSISASLASLFLLGAVSAMIFKVNMVKKGFRMFILGGIAIAAGIIVGQITNNIN